MPGQLCAISDLHISAGELDDCDKKLEQRVCAFLAMLSGGGDEVELVVNGDFLDFVQAPPWEGEDLEGVTTGGIDLCFTESQSKAKFDAIQAAHPDVFVALGKFLEAKPGNRLVILPGNHDVDFFWPAVQKKLKESVCGGDEDLGKRLIVHLERAYCPEGFPGVWIEHGHQFDPINRFALGEHEVWSGDNQPIEKDKWGARRLLSCLGTRFLIRFLNGVDAEYPMVDNVKPFGRFLRIFFWSALRLPWRFAAKFWAASAYFAKLRVTNKADYLSAGEEAPDPASALIERLKKIHGLDKTRGTWKLQRALRSAGFACLPSLTFVLEDPARWTELLDFIAKHPALVEEPETEKAANFLSTGGEAGMLSLKKGFKICESKLLADGAAEILEKNPDVNLVLMGHTHEAQERPDGLAYFNTGCWTRYYRFGDDEETRPFSILKEGSEKDFPFTLLYAKVLADAPGEATLEKYPDA